MILYHGSNVAVETPDLSKSKPHKDFGKGFYLSSDKHQAEDLAKQRVDRLHSGQITISAFSFDEKVLKSSELNIKIFEGYSEEWALFVIANRDIKRQQPCHNYDIVYGPIADDSVTISYEDIRMVIFHWIDLLKN